MSIDLRTKKSLSALLFLLFLFLFCSHSFVFAEQRKTVDWKPWSKYTGAERDSLRKRWTEDKEKEIVKALKEKKPLPAYVNLLTDILTDILEEAQKTSYDLRAITLIGVDLKNVNLNYAHLEGADLISARLEGAHLILAHLEGAYLMGAHLEGAYLMGAHLEGADLRVANLGPAKFYHAVFANTLVEVSEFEKAEDYRYIQSGKGSWQRRFDPEIAENLHRDMKNFFKKEGMSDMEKEYHYWENVARSHRLPPYERIPRLLFLEATYGYGSRPIWLLRASIFVIVGFALIFVILTLPRRTKSGIYLVKSHSRGKTEALLPFKKGRLFLDCFYFSLLSFTTFGYGAIQPRQWLEFFRLNPAEFKAVGWARVFVGLEAGSGIYILALLVTVLLGK